ncbi:MAG: hypothetical protein RL520_1537 [Pseudomonadota bacterium]|jgi:uncharacterized protein YcfJ
MKKLLSVIGMLAAFYLPQSQAQEVGRVISSIPIIQQVAVPRQVCTQHQVPPSPQSLALVRSWAP